VIKPEAAVKNVALSLFDKASVKTGLAGAFISHSEIKQWL
jgi:hypothetical protein